MYTQTIMVEMSWQGEVLITLNRQSGRGERGRGEERREREHELVFSCFLLSIQLQGGSDPWDGATCPWGGFLLLLSAIQKTLS